MAIKIPALPAPIVQNPQWSQTRGLRNEISSTPLASGGQLPGAETITLTDRAKDLLALEKAIAESPIVDLERVDSVKNSLANGSYDFNSERTTEKLLQLEFSLGAARK